MRNTLCSLALASLSLAAVVGCDSMNHDSSMDKPKADIKDANSPPAQNATGAPQAGDRSMGTTNAPVKDENDKMPAK